MAEQRTLEKLTIFCKSWKRWSVSCYTDRLLANQIAEKPVRISCMMYVSKSRAMFFQTLSHFWDTLYSYNNYLANIFQGRIEYELIYSHLVDYSVHIR